MKSSTSSAESTKRPSNRTLVRQATALKSKHLLVELTRTTRRFKTDGSPENNKAADGATEPKKDELFATDSPKSRDEIVRDAKSFQKQFDDALKKLSEGKEHEELHKDPQSLFSRYRKADGERDDFDGVTPRQEGIPNADSLRSATDLKLRRNTVLRKTLWYSFSEFAFDARRWGYMIKDRKLLLLYAALTAGLLAYVLLKPEDEYDFFQKREFEEEQRRRKAAEAEQDETEASATSRAWSSVTDFASHFSLIEPFRKIGYLFGGTIVAIRMLDATWRGDPLSEDERLIKAHTPVSIARDLRPDEYHHVSPLLRIMSTGHISEDPWTALIPPSPWAPHLTIVIESELLYSIGYNDRGEKVMRKRPFADYFLSALAENAEIIISSAHHSKASAKHFFKLFDPYGVASHTFTAEDHRWDGNGWIKPLEERYIGRRPERVLVLDGSYDHCGSMCQNVLRIKPWQGNSSDTTFLELTPVAKCTFSSDLLLPWISILTSFPHN